MYTYSLSWGQGQDKNQFNITVKTIVATIIFLAKDFKKFSLPYLHHLSGSVRGAALLHQVLTFKHGILLHQIKSFRLLKFKMTKQTLQRMEEKHCDRVFCIRRMENDMWRRLHHTKEYKGRTDDKSPTGPNEAVCVATPTTIVSS